MIGLAGRGSSKEVDMGKARLVVLAEQTWESDMMLCFWLKFVSQLTVKGDAMSYTVKLIDGVGTTLQDRTQGTAYYVSPGGVLTLVEVNSDDQAWRIQGEFAPGAWMSVDGTRFNGNKENLKGNDGVIVNGKYVP